MGADKATLPLADGQTLAGAVGAVLRAVADPALEVGAGASGLRHVSERVGGRGPLAAVAVGWEALSSAGYRGPTLVLACDMPFVTTGLLELIAGWPGEASVVPVVSGQAQPLCARLSVAALEEVGSLVAAGRRDMAAVFDAGPVDWLTGADWGRVCDAGAFRDLDYPADLAALEGTVTR